MTYQEIFDAAANTTAVRNRGTYAVAFFAKYIAGGGGNPSADRLAWARAALLDPASEFDRARWFLATDANFAAQGAGISDADLQAAVEFALSSIIPA